MRQELGPGAFCQTLLCMIVMVLNNVIWIRQKKFSAGRHILHYFIAAALLILYMPRKDWWPVMTDDKYSYMIMDIFVF